MVDQLSQGEEELSLWIGRSKTIEKVDRLPGDASTRRYYRIHAKGGATYILMWMESFASVGNGLDFIVVQQHLLEAGVDVPKILDVDADRGYILLEDLGDVTLLRRLQDVCNQDVERRIYQKIVDELVSMHINAAPEKSPGKDLAAFKLAFDHEKLMYEVNFCIEHFYEGYLKRTLTPEARAIMTDTFSGICTILAEEPRVFTHRDFHSRNVMVTPDGKGGDRLVMIDFQDARMGPAQYDLASLLKDSYYQLEGAQIDRLVDYYILKREVITGEEIDRDHFKCIFDLMSVQRNFKAIGSFGMIQNRRGNPNYLKYIGNTFENIRRTLLKYPQYARLRETLFHYYYF